MILILTKPNDEHADLIEGRLQAAGAKVVRFDRADYPHQASLSFGLTTGGLPCRRIVRRNGDDIDLERVTAIWHRRPGYPTSEPTLREPAMASYVHDEAGALMRDLWDSFDVPQLPSPRAVYRRAEHKYANLLHAVAEGFEVPQTLVTSDPKSLLEMYRACDGRLISKVVNQSLNNRFLAPHFNRFTEVVSPRDIARFPTVRHSATMFQGYVDKQVELRVTVVGDQVFAAQIHSQVSEHTKHDWRRYDHQSTPITTHLLPDEVESQCVALTHRLGLQYGAIDLIVTPDGRYVFLEINSNGQFMWVEQLTGLPICAAITDWLLRADADAGGRTQHTAEAI